MKAKSLALGCCLAVAAAANADVAYDEHGVGYVGKGDVQIVFDWNNAMLQENAALIGFRMLVAGATTWTCKGVNPAGHTVTQTHSSESQNIEAAVSYTARKNQAGMVTGFVLNGTGLGLSTYSNVGQCKNLRNWQVQPTFDVDSMAYEGSGEPLLQISIDGEEWHDLPITE
jgi:hypothetical protein